MTNAKPVEKPVILNAALFGDYADSGFILEAIAPYLAAGDCYLVTEDDALLPNLKADRRLSLASLPLESTGLMGEAIRSDLTARLGEIENLQCLFFDMTWCLSLPWSSHALEKWGGLVNLFAEDLGVPVISLYNQEMLVEDQMHAAFRVHRQFLAPSGIYENPHWLPQELLEEATLDVQLGFLLGRIVPEFANRSFHNAILPEAARGATPNWLPKPRHSIAPAASQKRWHIHCLGQLRVYVDGNTLVNWQIAGGAPKKSKALFAYLLNRGETGAHIDQVCEFLWPDGISEEGKRARLHHTISILRKTLGSADVLTRTGEYYQLHIPTESWIDIQSFEQFCRRGLALFRHNDLRAALRVYQAAERLYQGDLFEDLPIEYLQSDLEDWCLPKRIWLRDMAVKLQYDMSKLLRKQNRLREALEHCQKALLLDPVDDDANIELFRVLQAQDRRDAIIRHFRQYTSAMESLGLSGQSDEVQRVYQELVNINN